MKIFKYFNLILCMVSVSFLFSCEEDDGLEGFDGQVNEDIYGVLEVDFELPDFPLIQNGIRRVDLALCYTMDSMYRGQFFARTNVSDVKQLYQFNLLPGEYYYQAVITCTCEGDSCLYGGFPYGYGGMKYTFDKFSIVSGEKTYSRTTFQ